MAGFSPRPWASPEAWLASPAPRGPPSPLNAARATGTLLGTNRQGDVKVKVFEQMLNTSGLNSFATELSPIEEARSLVGVTAGFPLEVVLSLPLKASLAPFHCFAPPPFHPLTTPPSPPISPLPPLPSLSHPQAVREVMIDLSRLPSLLDDPTALAMLISLLTSVTVQLLNVLSTVLFTTVCLVAMSSTPTLCRFALVHLWRVGTATQLTRMERLDSETATTACEETDDLHGGTARPADLL